MWVLIFDGYLYMMGTYTLLYQIKANSDRELLTSYEASCCSSKSAILTNAISNFDKTFSDREFRLDWQPLFFYFVWW